MIKRILGLGFIILSIVGGLYLLFWWGIIEPIMNIAEMLDTKTYTFTGIAWEVIKMLVKDAVSVIWFYVFFFLGLVLMDAD